MRLGSRILAPNETTKSVAYYVLSLEQVEKFSERKT